MPLVRYITCPTCHKRMPRKEYPQHFTSHLRDRDKSPSWVHTQPGPSVQADRLGITDKPLTEEEIEEEARNDPMNAWGWKAGVADDFLKAWWDANPGNYKSYHKEFKGIGKRMISELRYRQEGTFIFVWERMVQLLEAEINPERPRVK